MEQPDETILCLSDAFPEEKRNTADIEVRVLMININKGHSPKLLSGCKPLEEYAWLVDQIRTNEQTMNLASAIDKALDDMPHDFEIRIYLEANRVEVQKMLLTEYDEKTVMELFKEEGREEGREEGHAAGVDEEKVSNLKTVMRKLKCTAQKAMDFLDVSLEDQKKYAPLLKEGSHSDSDTSAFSYDANV